MGCVVDYIAGIADFIKNSFVIFSLMAFVLYVHRRGWRVCWHRFVNAGILGKDQRHRVKYKSPVTVKGDRAFRKAIEGKEWVTAKINKADGLVIEDGIKMFILGLRTVKESPSLAPGDYLDILTDREISKEKFRGGGGEHLHVRIPSVSDLVVFEVGSSHDWQFIRTPSLLARLLGGE